VAATQNEENYVCGFAISSFRNDNVLRDDRCSRGETSADIFGLTSLQNHLDRGHLQHEVVVV